MGKSYREIKCERDNYEKDLDKLRKEFNKYKEDNEKAKDEFIADHVNKLIEKGDFLS